LLVLAAVYEEGPASRLGGFRRIPVNSPTPAAVAYRSGRMVHLAGGAEVMRRFPQVAVALPYDFGSASVPVQAGKETFGALGVVWAPRPGGLSAGQRRRLRALANRLGAALARLQAGGQRIEGDPETPPVEVSAAVAPAVRVGLFNWDLDTGALAGDGELCALFGIAPEGFDGRAATLLARVDPADRPGLRAAARTAVTQGRLLGRRLRVMAGDGRPRTVEVWGRALVGEGAAARLVGAIVDPGAGLEAVAAVERLGDGLFSLAPDGRFAYVNRGLEGLLHVRREEVLGRRLWEALPWLADPAYEDRLWSAMLSKQPTSFLACRPPDQWLAFFLHPDAHGVTGRAVPAAPPDPAATSANGSAADTAAGEAVAAPPTAPAPEPTPAAAPRLGAVSRVLQLGSALTEAVTAHQVCQAVTEQLLPAFGGQRMAIYIVREQRLHLLAQTGYPPGVLDRFEGTELQAPLPVPEALARGAPRFLASRQELAHAYPGLPAAESHAWALLPLIASNRPVGACTLGFDQPHPFPAEERTALTALAGLIAQALERARLYDAEAALARGLQTALLPHQLPTLPHLRLAGRYLPGTRGMDIGGDWYDALPTPSGLALIIGDVEGHHVTAAATMGQLRSAVRAFVTAGHRPREVIANTNRLLCDLAPGPLASCCYLHLDPATGTASAVRAGHPPPLLRHPDGHTDTLELPGGPLLGVLEAADYPETRLPLPPGSVLTLYTDGLVETRDADLDHGIDQLRTTLAQADTTSLDDLADRVLHDARHAPTRTDDIALLLTAYTPGHSGPRGGTDHPG
jgi:serine phosphatase RsbU (regulator of sigma subunit)/PAS domain-containing protein